MKKDFGLIRVFLFALVLAQAVAGGLDHCGFLNSRDCCSSQSDRHGPPSGSRGCDHAAQCCSPMLFLAPQALRLHHSSPRNEQVQHPGVVAVVPLGRVFFRPPIAAS